MGQDRETRSPQPHYYIHAAPDGVILSVQVQPKARQTELAGLFGDRAVRIRVAQPPVDARANRELVRFLAALFGVKASQVSILSGINSRSKRIKITGIGLDHALKQLKL